MSRIFLAGATGVIGIRLLPLLLAEGHTVAAMTRSESKRAMLTEMGAQPVVCNVYDADMLRASVVTFAPDAVVHQLTDLPDNADEIGEYASRNAQIRNEGTRNLLAAATAAGARHFLAQSIAWTPAAGAASLVDFEGSVLAFGGVVVKYGQLYGPGTYYESDLPTHPRIHVDDAARRTVPLVSAPSGVVVLADEEEAAG
jgi:threonine dehydrogenase-like Zn-dependent dehydrogenase